MGRAISSSQKGGAIRGWSQFSKLIFRVYHLFLCLHLTRVLPPRGPKSSSCSTSSSVRNSSHGSPVSSQSTATSSCFEHG
ncbi:hypothetical protein MATL_G00181580 [Megalops atlanticus]|uniref:Uncharacterized protein n=1 Tax=Megalops atlanticus TaxID=7932 RepID=A0A9D3PMF5_MEGAT|nr:hypothetical protein MATL_G00181580 [Megalops atlanticus]